MNCVRGHTEIYIEISGIHALWDHVKRMSAHGYSVRDLFDREYGMTEFHIEDPNGCLVFVGRSPHPSGDLSMSLTIEHSLTTT